MEDLARRGYRSMIAHLERHADEQLATHLKRLASRGALVQVTAALLGREHAAPVIVELARKGLVHLLGSDAHSSRAGRPVRLSEVFEILRRTDRLRGTVDWMAREAPAAIVAGEDVAAPLSPP